MPKADPDERPAANGKDGPLWPYFLAAALAFLGYIYAREYAGAIIARRTWTPTSGEIISHEVRPRAALYGEIPSEKPYIEYSYDINSATYHSGPVAIYPNRPFLGDSASTLLAEEFPVGKKITVYYNPDYPAASSLGGAGTAGPAVAASMFILALLAVQIGRRRHI